MFGLELIMAGMLNLTPPAVHENVLFKKECDAKAPAKIVISPSKSRVKYNFSKTKAQLNNIDVDTVSPYGAQHKTTVSGLMSGALQIEQEVRLINETYTLFNYGCVYINSIDVKINIEPTIYIAKEHPQGSCMHNAVLIHERKHVREDQLIINKYVNLIEYGLRNALKKLGSTHGPIDQERIPYVQKNLQTALNKVIIRYSDQMNEERRRRQQSIDNIEEYDQVGRRCRSRNK